MRTNNKSSSRIATFFLKTGVLFVSLQLINKFLHLDEENNTDANKHTKPALPEVTGCSVPTMNIQ